jgi:hypothetical protein
MLDPRLRGDDGSNGLFEINIGTEYGQPTALCLLDQSLYRLWSITISQV